MSGTRRRHRHGTEAAPPTADELITQAAEILHKDTPRALALAAEARELAGADNTLLLSEIQRILGVGNAVSGNYLEAIECFRRGLELNESIEHHRGSATMLTNIGNVYNFLGDYSSALTYYERSRELCERYTIEVHLPTLYLNMAYSHRGLNNYDMAIANLTSGFTAAGKTGNDRVKAHILHNLGNIHLTRGDYTAALHNLGSSLAVNTELNNRHGMSAVLNDIGAIHFQFGNYGLALRHFKRSLDICEAMGDKRGVALALNNIGELYATYGRHDSALRYFTDSLRIKEELNNSAEIAGTLLNIGKMYGSLGNHQDAIDHCRRCIHMAETIDDKHLLADALCVAAEHYSRTSEQTKARTSLRKALRLFTGLGHTEGQARAELALGMAYLNSDTAKGIALLTNALQTAETTEAHPLLMRIHKALSQACKQVGDTASALHHYERFHSIEQTISAEENERSRQRLLILFDMERERRNRELAEKEAGILRLENSRLEQEMDFRSKELVTTAMYLTQKNAFLKKLHHALRDICGTVPQAAREPLHRLLREITTAVDAEQSWTHFERQFRQVHEEYIELLAGRFTDITPTELKVCSLIKLNLSTKEIANILNTEPRSIEKYRQRIRRKLGLTQRDNLVSFLHSLH